MHHEMLEEEENFYSSEFARGYDRRKSERSRTREILIQCLVVRQMREDSTTPHLFDQHHDSRSSLLLVLALHVVTI